MIKELADMQKITMNVMLKDGTQFHGMDITGHPFGQDERVVSFWLGDVIRVYPMSEVAYVELVPESGNDQLQPRTEAHESGPE